jgi:hypothetical protein
MIDPLYSLRKLAAANEGITVEYLRDLVSRGDLAPTRRTPRGRIFIAESEWQRWQQSQTAPAKSEDEKAQGLTLVPPKRAPNVRDEPVNIDHLLPPGYKKVFARSA